MKRLLSVLMFLGVFAVSGGAQADLVGVDFGSNPNPTPQNWTSSNGSSSLTNLQDDTGRTTSVGLSFSAIPGAFNATALSSSVPSHTYNLSNISNNIYSFGGSLTMTLSGLTPGQSYPVYVFGLRGGAPYSQNISLIGSNTVTFTQAGSANTLTINDQVGTSSSNLSAYARTITADSSGNIQVVVGAVGYYVAGLAIDVPPPAYTVGGSVTGLAAGQSVVLLNNAGNSTTVNSNTSFTFSTAINSGGAYAVTVGTQPTGQTCTVTNGSGTVSANVTNVSVSCVVNPAQPIPTLGEWGMIFMASLMAMFGIRRMRRSK